MVSVIYKCFCYPVSEDPLKPSRAPDVDVAFFQPRSVSPPAPDLLRSVVQTFLARLHLEVDNLAVLSRQDVEFPVRVCDVSPKDIIVF